MARQRRPVRTADAGDRAAEIVAARLAASRATRAGRAAVKGRRGTSSRNAAKTASQEVVEMASVSVTTWQEVKKNQNSFIRSEGQGKLLALQ